MLKEISVLAVAIIVSTSGTALADKHAHRRN